MTVDNCQAVLVKNLTVRLPSNLQSTRTQSHTITQMAGQTVTGIVDTVRINSQPFVTAFDGNAKRYTNTTAEGRKTFVNVDSKGNVTVDSIAGFAAVKYSYDSKGRLAQSQQGGRVSSFSYNPEGQLSSVVDPLGHTTGFFYDAVGRVARQVLPDGREILYTGDGQVRSAKVMDNVINTVAGRSDQGNNSVCAAQYTVPLPALQTPLEA